MFFWGTTDSSTRAGAASRAGLSCPSVSWRRLCWRTSYFNPLVRAVYTLASVWLGLVNFFFLAACACWIVYGVPLPVWSAPGKARRWRSRALASAFSRASAAIVNAAWTRVMRVTVKLPNLPASWRGRTAALVSDLHLGHVRNRRFLRRIVRNAFALAARTFCSFRATCLTAPPWIWRGWPNPGPNFPRRWARTSSRATTSNSPAPRNISMPCSSPESACSKTKKLFSTACRSWVCTITIRRTSENFDRSCGRLALDRDVASILLVHNPDRLPVAAEAGISLQLSGHTHRGQFFPFTPIVSRMYGKFAYGLNRFGDLAVYTSCGAGTWGPPMRLGSNPEIVY